MCVWKCVFFCLSLCFAAMTTAFIMTSLPVSESSCAEICCTHCCVQETNRIQQFMSSYIRVNTTHHALSTQIWTDKMEHWMSCSNWVDTNNFIHLRTKNNTSLGSFMITILESKMWQNCEKSYEKNKAQRNIIKSVLHNWFIIIPCFIFREKYYQNRFLLSCVY